MDIFKNRNFVRLFFAAFASQMGTTVGNMTFAFYLLDHYSSQPAYATIAELMYSLPTILVFLVVGVVADRFDRQKVAENCDWIRAVLTIVLYLSIMLESIPLIFAIIFIRSAITKFFFPAESSLVQGILSKEQYAKAAGLNQMLFSLFMIFGVGLGAFMYKTIGLQGAIVVDFISFIISGFLIRACRIPIAARLPNGKSTWRELTIKRSLTDFKTGFLYIVRHKLLASLVWGFFIFGFTNGAFAVLPMFTMKFKFMHEHYEWYTSLFTISVGIGLLVGCVVGTVLAERVKTHFLLSIPIGVTSVLITILGYTDSLYVFFPAAFVSGVCLGPANIAIAGWLPKIVDPKLMGRVSGWIDPLMMFAQSLTLGLIAILFPTYITDISYLYYGIGIALLLVFLFYSIQLPKYSAQKGPNQGH